MANAVFTTKVSPIYNDLPELQYHFPRRYFNQASQTVGDWIIYYEPRREGADLSGRAGRQTYFAVARVREIIPDPAAPDYFYAFVSDYLEFDEPVPFRRESKYLESAVRKADGSTNKGAFGRSVRLIPSAEFQMICRAGFVGANERLLSNSSKIAEDPMPPERSIKKQLQERTFRDASFSRTIRRTYEWMCAMTGLNLTNGKGGYEVEAAHIKPVSALGPDSPRNGIALSRTIHWMFDEGILSISEGGEILTAKKLVPDKVRRVLHEDGMVVLPSEPSLRPHNEFLRFHREHRFKG